MSFVRKHFSQKKEYDEVIDITAGKRIIHQVIDNNSRHAYKNE